MSFEGFASRLIAGEPALAGPSPAVDADVGRGRNAVPATTTKIRTDIQLLRAWAILSVMANHAGLPFLPGGVLGVDIFFVISGYLMTGLIDEGLTTGTFTFRGFYARRIRRLLPAAYLTLTVTAIAAPILLDASEYQDFVAQLVGAFTFSANVVLWKQVDYFSTAAVMKPLLHIWSLSLEEQYYLILPAMLFLCPRRLRLWLSLAVVAISAVFCIAIMTRSVSAAFYLLPSRAWELGIGSVVAMAVRRNLIDPRAMPVARTICVLLLLGVPALASENGHPGIPALIICLATALLLIPGADIRRDRPALAPLCAIGDRSYSLYLIHWPLLAFAGNMFITPVPLWINGALLGLGFVLTELQYRLVERPLRTFRITRRSATALIALPLLLCGASGFMAWSIQSSETLARENASGLSPACDFKGDFVPVKACTAGPAPDTLVWGDSFAMALAPGVAASSRSGIVQATRTVCGPFIGLAPVDDAFYNRAWAERCLSFNNSVFDYLAKHREIQKVVLTSALTGYVPGSEDHAWRFLVGTVAGSSEQRQDIDVLLSHVETTVAHLRSIGKKVVFVAPPPSSGVDIARCIERRDEGKITIPLNMNCTLTMASYHAHSAEVLKFMAALKATQAIPVLDLDTTLCRAGRCAARLGGTLLYRDRNHLSYGGSIALGKMMDWGATIQRLTR